MTSPGPAWAALAHSIAGSVALPGSPEYERLPAAFNARFHHLRPQAVVRCAEPEDVAEAVSFVARHGLRMAARSGGHCFAGHSSTEGVVVDVSPMASVSLSERVATIGAGARLGAVYDALQAHGLAIAGGTCPPVGIAGLTLGGGLGLLGRMHGVTCDLLVGAQVVTADGGIVECDEQRHDDLFWALRGAGAGNFGVVTSLSLRAVPAPDATHLHARWPVAHAAAVVGAWQRWAPSAPDELAASLKVTASGDVDQPPSVDLYAALFGPESEAVALLGDLVARVGIDPAAASHQQLSFAQTRDVWARLGAEGEPPEGAASPPDQPRHLIAKSEFFRRLVPADAIDALVDHLTRGRAPGESRELDFMPWGGAYNRVRPEATAFVHREELFQLKHAAVIEPGASAHEDAAARRWVAGSWALVHPWASGRVFQNFADPDLDGWASAYHGTNYDRLVRVKARYDPGDVFHFPQSLPVR